MKDAKHFASRMYKPLMAGLLTGYLATLINIIYDVTFKDYTEFPLTILINVSTIVFVTLFLLLLAGLVFSLFENLLPKGHMIYRLVFGALTLFLAFDAFRIHRADDPVLNNEFHYLLFGIVIVTGLSATFMVPFLVRHEKLIL
jgi:hypothetical protein